MLAFAVVVDNQRCVAGIPRLAIADDLYAFGLLIAELGQIPIFVFGEEAFDGLINAFGKWCEQDAPCKKKYCRQAPRP